MKTSRPIQGKENENQEDFFITEPEILDAEIETGYRKQENVDQEDYSIICQNVLKQEVLDVEMETNWPKHSKDHENVKESSTI